jgi:hypothetical protein
MPSKTPAPRGYRRQTQFDRNMEVCVGILEQESNPEKEDHDAGTSDHVAVDQPLPDRRRPLRRRCRPRRDGLGDFPGGFRPWSFVCFRYRHWQHAGGQVIPFGNSPRRLTGRHCRDVRYGHRRVVLLRHAPRQGRNRLQIFQRSFKPTQALVDGPEAIVGFLPCATAQAPAEHCPQQGSDDPQRGMDFRGEKRPHYGPEKPHPPALPRCRWSPVSRHSPLDASA